MNVGATRVAFCEDCEKQTDQVLKHLSKNGIGKPVIEMWRCLRGDHYVGMRPGPVPKELA